MYRRRRLAALIVLLVVIGLAWLLIAHPWTAPAPAKAEQAAPAQPVLPAVTSTAQPSGAPTPGVSTPPPIVTPPPSATPGATATPRPGASAAACTSANITVHAVTDRTTYAAGEDPKLSIRLVNHGPACTMNVGTATQVFTIASGADTWWRSTDCQSHATDTVVTIEAGQTVTSTQPLVWDRTRSSVATCQAKNRPAAPAGGATYRLSVSIGGIASATSTAFTLG